MPDKVSQQAMPTSGSPEDDAAGALEGGQDQHGVPNGAPRKLGRKDPTTTGDTAPDKDNVQIRPNEQAK